MFRMQTASDVRKLMVHQIPAVRARRYLNGFRRGPSRLSISNASWTLKIQGLRVFEHYRSKADIGNVCFAPEADVGWTTADMKAMATPAVVSTWRLAALPLPE